MIDLSICRKIRLGVSVLLVVVVLYVNLSCHHAVKEVEYRYPSSNFKESGKCAVGASVVKGKPEDIDSAIFARDDVVTWNAREISECLTADREWRLSGDAVKTRLCKLICKYLIRLVEDSGDGNDFKDPVLSLDSLYGFLKDQGVRLKVKKKVVDQGGSRGCTTDDGNGVTYVINDVVFDRESSSSNKTDGDLLIGFDIDSIDNTNNSISGTGGKYVVLYQLLRAMFWDSTNDVYSSIRKCFSHLHDKLRDVRFNPDDEEKLLQNAKKWEGVDRKHDADLSELSISRDLFSKFALYAKSGLLKNVLRFVEIRLFEIFESLPYDTRTEDNQMLSVLPGTNSSISIWIAGLFAGALVRVPVYTNTWDDRKNGYYKSEEYLKNLGHPFIFYIKQEQSGEEPFVEVRLLGIAQVGGRFRSESALRMSGYFYSDQTGLMNSCGSSGMTTNGGGLKMFEYDRSNVRLKDLNLQSRVPDMGKIVSDLANGYKIHGSSMYWRSLSYQSSLAYFYKDLLLVSLRKLEALL